MVPTHATKQGVRYRYYVSQPYLRGLATPPIGAIVRVPAPDIEAVVSKALREYLAQSNTAAAEASQPSIRAMVARIEVRNSHLAVWLIPSAEGADESTGPPAPIEENSALLIPWTKPPAKRFKEILLPASTARSRARPMKAERRTALIKSIARGRAWLDEIVSGTASIEGIAARQKGGATYGNDQIHRARTCLARRDRLRHCQHRSHCRAPEVQCSSRQHDDIDGIHRACSGEGRRRRAASARHRHRHLA